MFFAHHRARRFRAHHHPHHHPGPGGGHGRGFGVRRPLRFLMDRLDLDDAQVAEVSKLLEDYRLEREQAQLDRRRSASRIADLLAADTLDQAAVAQAADARVAAAKRARDALVDTITKLHAALGPEQRVKLSTLLRSGPLSL